MTLWLFALLTAGALSSVAERCTAGAPRRGWDVATLLAALGGLLLVLAHVLHVFG